jgi:hypothetical protein
LALVLDDGHALGRLRAQIDDLDFPVFVAGKTRIIEREAADNDRNDLLFENVGELQLFLAFAAVERIGRGQKQNRFAGRIWPFEAPRASGRLP